MTLAVNLLAARRVEALRRRRRTRAWSLTLAAYVLAIFAVWSGFAASMQMDSPAKALADVQVRLDARTTEQQSLTAELAKLRSQADLADAVADHPDWSLLLRLIAGANGEAVALNRITLITTPAPSTVKGSDLPEHGPWSLSMAGLAPSQRAASEFVARLEALNLFASVTLTETRERAGVAGDSPQVDFAVVCTMTERVPAGGRP